MRNSSLQLELEYPDADANRGSAAIDVDLSAGDPGRGTSASATVGFGRFTGAYSTLDYAHNARMAGRALAASVSEAEYKALLDERQQLLDKKFANDISRKDLNRLQYVRWSLDRIEDAKYGAALDLLESYAMQYEQFVSDLRTFHEELQEAAKMKDEFRGRAENRRR